MRPIISLGPRATIEVEVPRSSAFAHDVRLLIPRHKKDPRSNVWIVEFPFLQAIRVLLEVHFGQFYDRTGVGTIDLPDGFEVAFKKQSSRSRWKAPELALSPYSVLFLLENAPIEVARAAHRALAKIYHPDAKHSDGVKMSEINAAMDRIEAKHEANGGRAQESR